MFLRWRSSWRWFTLLSILAFALTVFVPPGFSQQTKVAADCSITLQARSTTGTSSVFDNRPQSSQTGIPCTQWIVIASATTANASFTVQAQSAQDNGSTNCSTCSWVSFGTALTAEGSQKIASSYGDFLRINLSAISGGTVSVTLNGWRDNASSIK